MTYKGNRYPSWLVALVIGGVIGFVPGCIFGVIVS